jgi:type IV pilus assembly protein PilM
MAITLRKQTSDGVVGLDIDGGFVAAAQLNGDGVQRAASRSLESDIVRDGEVLSAERLGDALKEFFREESLPRRVRLGVANQQIVVRHIEMPKIADQSERDAAIRFQTAETVAMPLDEAVIDYQTVGESTADGGVSRERILVVAARKAMILRLTDAARRAGLKPEGVDLSAFALVRTLAGSSHPDGEARVYCHLGGVANVAVALGSNCLFTRPLTADWEGGDGAVESLAEELRMSIEYYRTQADAPPVRELVLSGPGARIEGLAERVGELIGLAAHAADPLGRMSAAPFPEDEDPYHHTVSLGLALGASE